jgi:hypothetical protein
MDVVIIQLALFTFSWTLLVASALAPHGGQDASDH